MISVILSDEKATWQRELDIPAKYQEWRVIESMKWTNKFNETWFFASEPGKSENWEHGTINLPNKDGLIFVDLLFMLEKSGNILPRNPTQRSRQNPTSPVPAR